MAIINQYDMSRLYTAVLLSLFDDIQLARRDPLNPYTVPITYTSKSRLYKKLYSESSKADGVMYSMNLPAMALSFNTFTPNLERQTNRMLKKRIVEIDATSATVNWNDVATDFDYTLTIVGKSLTELTNIAEYIVSTFKNQLYYVNVKTPLYPNDPISTPIKLTTTTVNIDNAEEEYAGDRMLECVLDFTIQGILHNNVTTDSKFITSVQLNAYMDLEFAKIAQSYEVTNA